MHPLPSKLVFSTGQNQPEGVQNRKISPDGDYALALIFGGPDSGNAHDRIILGGQDYPQQILGIQNTDSGKTLPERRRPAGHESNYDRLLINKIYSNLSVFHT